MIFAAAGLAEAAWAAMSGLIILTFGVVGITTLVGTIFWPRRAPVVHLVIWLAATFVLQPFYCFAPFEPEAYNDPDVQSAAGMFFFAGKVWLGSLIPIVAGFIVAAWARRKRSPDQPTPSPSGQPKATADLSEE